MPRLRRVPQAPSAAAAARRRQQAVIYLIIGVIVLRTMGSEYSFLQDMKTSISYRDGEQYVAQSGYRHEQQHSDQSDRLPNYGEEADQIMDDETHNTSISTTEPILRCSELSKTPDIFDSCIRQSPKYVCQQTNSADMDFQWTVDQNCDQTESNSNAALREILPKVLNELNIKSVIRYYDDGDNSNDWKMFPFWVHYFAIGTSDEMEKKQRCFGNEHIHFHRFDLTCTVPPPVDLIWVRDLSLVSEPVRSALLYHIQESGIQYLMTGRLNATWFNSEDEEKRIVVSVPLFTSFEGSEQQMGVWKSPFVEDLPGADAREYQGETDDGEERDEETDKDEEADDGEQRDIDEEVSDGEERER